MTTLIVAAAAFDLGVLATTAALTLARRRDRKAPPQTRTRFFVHLGVASRAQEKKSRG